MNFPRIHLPRIRLRRLPLAAALGLALSAPAGAQPAPAGADAALLVDCVSAKAGPEGDLPPSGPLRAQILAQMEGGPQACIGLVEAACAKAGGDADGCRGRESRGWLAAIEPDTAAPVKNKAVWRKAADKVRAQAIGLCEGAAALAAWGSDAVAKKGRYGFTLNDACVRDAIAQQALILLVHVRGN